ncbi:hypothetical protein QUF80_18880 [Desulfococcaceae bacterium HSG8]|nr:hypothetical protein [Desulfococcaceae bacterium HSG8]
MDSKDIFPGQNLKTELRLASLQLADIFPSYENGLKQILRRVLRMK